MASVANQFSATQAAREIAAGRLTSEALVRACLARIAERESTVQAWAFLDPERAIEQARACDRGPRRGPLHGVPVGVKDVIDTADMPTAYNSPIYAGHRPRWDAACVAAARRAGAVILGRSFIVGPTIGPGAAIWFATWARRSTALRIRHSTFGTIRSLSDVSSGGCSAREVVISKRCNCARARRSSS